MGVEYRYKIQPDEVDTLDACKGDIEEITKTVNTIVQKAFDEGVEIGSSKQFDIRRLLGNVGSTQKTDNPD